MPKLTIIRPAGYINRLRNYNVYVDDVKVGTVANGKDADFEIAPGEHNIYCKIDWCSSLTISFHANENETRVFTVTGFKAASWMMPIAIALVVLNLFVRPEYKKYFWILLAPVLLILIYYTTIGRKNYLTLKQDF